MTADARAATGSMKHNKISENRIMSYAKRASRQNTATNREIALTEEEISDVSLATFYGFDGENPRPRQRVVPGGGCGCGCAQGCGPGCGGG